MSKFKVGDKVRCVKDTRADGVRLGNVYTVEGYDEHCRKYGCVLLVEVRSSPYEACFELVEHNPVLTPEEVFDHLRKGTKLQWRYKDVDRWQDCINSGNVQVRCILDSEWRIKPEPEVIELNGKKYREIIE